MLSFLKFFNLLKFNLKMNNDVKQLLEKFRYILTVAYTVYLSLSLTPYIYIYIYKVTSLITHTND